MAVQKAIYRFEGSLNKFLVDDKGATLLTVFGLPPLAHEDDPERAVLSAVAIADELHRLKLNCYIGVTSGMAFCGPVGSGSRREYSVLGDVVNTSARLMQMAASLKLTNDTVYRGCILTDAATKKSAESNPSIVFQPPVLVQLRGKAGQVEVFQPGLLKDTEVPISPMWVSHTPSVLAGFVGFHADIVAKVSGMLAGDHVPGTVVISGETGCGKTTLIKLVVVHLSDHYDAAVGVPMPVDESRMDYATEEGLREVRLCRGSCQEGFLICATHDAWILRGGITSCLCAWVCVHRLASTVHRQLEQHFF